MEKPEDKNQPAPPHRLRPSGGYRKLRSFRVTTIIYDATVSFCERFVDPRSRTVDQMVQAARSGRQNIAEGSRASGTSSQTELRLVNVARASLDELLLDYEDYLRQRGRPQWDKDHPQAQAVRAIGLKPVEDQSEGSDATLYSPWLTHSDPEVVANTIICLIHQANYLLDRQVAALESDFIHEGGYSERLAAARVAQRQGNTATNTPPAPNCPTCGKPMVLRTTRKGDRAGSQFWGCSAYPACRGTRPV
ncbi:MAG: four helix bundle suffix domain-containing protein [Candidatus Brocadiia bacterium]